jgi:hypothetical protein
VKQVLSEVPTDLPVSGALCFVGRWLLRWFGDWFGDSPADTPPARRRSLGEQLKRDPRGGRRRLDRSRDRLGGAPGRRRGPGGAGTRRVTRLGRRAASVRPSLRGYFKMLTARATTSATVTSDTIDWAAMSILAQRDIGSVSVGEKAVALVKLRYR